MQGLVEEKQVYVLIDSFWAGAFEFDVRDWFLTRLAEYNVRFFVSSHERAIDPRVFKEVELT